MRLQDIAAVAPIEIRREAAFSTPGLLSDPQPGMLVFLEHARFLPALRRTPEVACVLTTSELADCVDAAAGLAVTAQPRRLFWEFHNHLALHTQFYWADFPTEIDPTAQVHPRAFVADKNVRIGPGAVVEPNAAILERCLIGAGVVIRAGAVLGAAGFQSARIEDRVIEMIHAGGLRLCDRAQVFSGAVIARAIFGQLTTLGEDARVGNAAFVSHNVQAGPRCFIGHGSVINGNVRLGADVWIGPGAVLAHAITAGDGARISLGSAVIQDVPAGGHVTGNVALEHRRFLRHIASLKASGGA